MVDDEIQEIVDRAEAGVADAMRAYEAVERQYFEAAAQAPTEPTYITTTVATTPM